MLECSSIKNLKICRRKWVGGKRKGGGTVLIEFCPRAVMPQRATSPYNSEKSTGETY